MNRTIVLADDHRMFRQGVRALLAPQVGVTVVGDAADGPSAVRLCERHRPDVLVLDLLMPGLCGLDVIRRMSRLVPRTRVVILSMYGEPAHVLEARKAGALGYVLKDAGTEELLAAIKAACEGEAYLSPPLTEAALSEYAARLGAAADPFDLLTDREREVLQLTAEGATSGDIAARLFLSPRTVESHRNNLMRKLAVRNQKELVRLALARGLALPPLNGQAR